MEILNHHFAVLLTFIRVLTKALAVHAPEVREAPGVFHL